MLADVTPFTHNDALVSPFHGEGLGQVGHSALKEQAISYALLGINYLTHL